MRASCAAWQQAPVCGGHGPRVMPPVSVWQRLRRLQGQLRRAQRRALDAKAALRREVSRRRRAEAAREEERRGRAQLRRQLRALQLATTAEAWTTLRVAPATESSPRSRGAATTLPTSPCSPQVAPPPRASPRSRCAAIALPASPCSQASSLARGSPRSLGVAIALPTSPCSRRAAAEWGSPRSRSASLALPSSPCRAASLARGSPRSRGAALALPDSPRPQDAFVVLAAPYSRCAAPALPDPPCSPPLDSSAGQDSPRSQCATLPLPNSPSSRRRYWSSPECPSTEAAPIVSPTLGESGMISSCACSTIHSSSPARALGPQWGGNLERSPSPAAHSRAFLAEASMRVTVHGLCEQQLPTTSLDADQAELCVYARALRLQKAECEQRSGLICSEAERRQLLQAHCWLAAEEAARAEIMGHEIDALDLLTAATDAPSGIASASEVVRPPTAASEVLFVDHICSSLAAFVPRHWAPVCSKAARFVHGVLSIYSTGFRQLAWRMGYNQSMGSYDVDDNSIFGPGLGLFAWCASHLRHLKVTVKALDPPPTLFCLNWVQHMDVRLAMCEDVRLRHRELYLDALLVRENLLDVQTTLEQVLTTFDQRTASSSDEETDPADLA
eukprot:TRINITY_DN10579_c0_g1_i11.p1 TRINITY_DN10579_c0_g1~~TRINITY_DN10579_c0_g1_i11.p1  ORF type:complete len:645 (+),score=62.79 TRINITY_DN10579_c0_g1_i11:85-1935(+)